MSDTKICRVCEEEKLVTEFSPRRSSSCGFVPYCRPCRNKKNREWRIKRETRNPSLYKEKRKKKEKRWQERHPDLTTDYWQTRREKGLKEGTIIDGWVAKTYTGVPCFDCGNVFPFCAMDFDHRPEEIKLFAISKGGNRNATSKNITKIEKEISKCDLVCSNCHRIRTHITRKK